MIRLALLADRPAALARLRRLLAGAQGIEVLAAAADEVALARALDRRRPDILIVEHDPARGGALAPCRRIKSRPGTPRVLIYSPDAGRELTVAARAAQADGLVDQNEPACALIAAIRRIARAETVVGRPSYGSISPRRIA